MRRLAGATLALCLAVAAAGCGTGTGATNDAKNSTTLVFWHYFTDRADLFDKFAADYRKQTGVTVKMTLVPGDTLGEKFQAAAQANTLPDISAAWTGIGEKTAPYAKSNRMMNLRDAMDSGWNKTFQPSMLAAASFPEDNTFGVEPGPYLVPLDSNNMQFLYNKKLFAQAGIDGPPTTFAEFLDDSRKLSAAGIAPFVAGLGAWPLGALAQVYQWNIIGEEKLNATFSGKLPYTSSEWREFLRLFVTLGKSGALAKGTLTNDAPAAESLFVNGQAAMIFDGSWALGVFKQQNPNFVDYGVFVPPSAGPHPVRIPGGVGAMAFVVGSSPQSAEAVKFLRWLTETSQQTAYASSSLNLPANVEAAGGQKLDPNLAAFASRMDALIPTLGANMPAPVDTTMQKGLQRILAGEDTPEHVAELMQKAATTGRAQ
ncbi:ABC transporter substrate-binding protein [Micromonospora sp. NPDC047740]|uniref:ABC transporter substrate-binding protein n=1 Tax=Micromonospora sp. NPDC047740 TaxID=3364254 RepID=UPI00371AACD2